MAAINYDDPSWYAPQAGDARIGLTEGQKRAIQSAWIPLTTDMSPRDVMDHMISDLVMGMDEIVYEGKPKKTVRRDIVEKVLRTNLECLKSFMRALEHEDGGSPHLAELLNKAFKEHCARDIDTCPEYDAPGGYMKPPPSFTRAAKPVQATDAVPVAVKSTGDRGTMASLHAANKSLRGEADDSEVTSSTIGALDDDLAREDVFHHMITDRALRRMCRKFGAWEDVAMQLDLTKADRENIEHDGPWTRSLPAQVYDFLSYWRHKMGRDANCRNLIPAMRLAGKERDVIDAIKAVVVEEAEDTRREMQAKKDAEEQAKKDAAGHP